MTQTLAQFIREQHDAILAEWDKFARGLDLGRQLDDPAIRNHAARLLDFIAEDMDSSQSAHEQREKSQGRAEAPEGAADTSAHEHGLHRLGEGFTLNQMVSEYRALRATVMRLWREREPESSPEVIDQLVRFNESMDQLLAESIERFSSRLDKSRDLFLGVLGHDLRSPLGAVHATAFAWSKEPALSEKDSERVRRLLRGTERMRTMVWDLLDLTRTRLGLRLPIEPASCDLGIICEIAIEEVQASHPGRVVDYAAEGDLAGNWDPARMAQLVSNLLVNALQHGSSDRPVAVSVKGQNEGVLLAVRNDGVPISASRLGSIFDPLLRKPNDDDHATRSMGLGLYIAKQITEAHRGRISVESNLARGTTFSIRLPRQSASALPRDK